MVKLTYEVKKLQRAGHSSARISKVVQRKFKKVHGGRLPGKNATAAAEKIQAVHAETLRKQRYHLTKQLQQAIKKAKAFLVRKQMRRAKEAGKAQEGETDRLQILKALPVQEVARNALASLDMEAEAASSSGVAPVSRAESGEAWQASNMAATSA